MWELFPSSSHVIYFYPTFLKFCIIWIEVLCGLLQFLSSCFSLFLDSLIWVCIVDSVCILASSIFMDNLDSLLHCLWCREKKRMKMLLPQLFHKSSKCFYQLFTANFLDTYFELIGSLIQIGRKVKIIFLHQYFFLLLTILSSQNQIGEKNVHLKNINYLEKTSILKYYCPIWIYSF